MRRKIVSFVFTALLVMGFSSCGNYGIDEFSRYGDTDLSNYGDPPVTFKTATITHEGFDFATGTKSTADGEVVSWCPNGGQNTNYANNAGYLWWRSAYEVDSSNITIIHHYGEVDLTSIKSAPNTWDEPDLMSPLLKNHCFVIKCLNGYAKFRVLEVYPDSEFWDVDIEYQYSTSGTF